MKFQENDAKDASIQSLNEQIKQLRQTEEFNMNVKRSLKKMYKLDDFSSKYRRWREITSRASRKWIELEMRS